MTQTTAPSASHLWSCFHCGLPVPGEHTAPQTVSDAAFCCRGCKSVYNLLNQCDLSAYYRLKKESGSAVQGLPVDWKPSRFDYLDDPAARERLAYGPEGRRMDFFIEGAHCVACLWLLERVGHLVKEVRDARMDLGTHVLRVEMDPGGSFARAAEAIESLGYRPHPVSENQEAANLRRIENRRDLLRIGTAAFCAMNLMLLFVAIYGGVGGFWLATFRWLSGAFYLPIAFYAAVPFYRSALASLRSRQIHVDLPVALALALASAVSYRNLFTGSEHMYFDSLAAFVFLLLSARHVLKVFHQKAAAGKSPGEFLLPRTARRVVAGIESVSSATDASLASDAASAVSAATAAIAVERLTAGDRIRVADGETIPADGEVVSSSGYADFHMITGESAPVRLVEGSAVYAGTVNAGPELEIRVTAAGGQTRVERLLQSVADLKKPAAVQAADLAAKGYLIVILAAAGGVFGFFGWNAAGLDRALSLIIIACPCALALATPLAYQMAWREFAAAGAVLKSSDAIEKLARARHLFLDKTGTLTHGQFEVLDWEVISGAGDLAGEAYALETGSQHPVAHAIRAEAARRHPSLDPPAVEGRVETPGVGVEGWIDGRLFAVRGLSPGGTALPDGLIRSEAGLFEEEQLRVRIAMGDRLRSESAAAIARLRRQFISVCLLTGDRRLPAEEVARRVGIECIEFESGPESKKARLESEPDALMVGDGANDAAAFKAAGVSIAVQGSMEASLACADIYLVTPGIGRIPDLVAIARRTRRSNWAAIAVSLAYNAAGIGLAAAGVVTPLVAAIAMPVSSVTVLAIAYFGIRRRPGGVVSWKSF